MRCSEWVRAWTEADRELVLHSDRAKWKKLFPIWLQTVIANEEYLFEANNSLSLIFRLLFIYLFTFA